MGTFTPGNEVCNYVPFSLEGVVICALGFFLSFRSAVLFSLIASSISAATNGFLDLKLFMNFDGMWL